MTSEMGKPLPESRAEVNYGTAFISWFAEEGLRVYGDTLPILNRGERILVTRQAVGLVGWEGTCYFFFFFFLHSSVPPLHLGISH